MLSRVLAFSLLALPLAACNTTGATIGSALGSVAGSIAGSATGDAVVANVSPATISKAQTYARAACAIVPAADSLRELFAASNGSLATASSLARAACGALVTGASYSAKRKSRKGEKVDGVAIINGKSVVVTGTVAK